MVTDVNKKKNRGKVQKAKPPPEEAPVAQTQMPIRKEFIVYLSISPGGKVKVDWDPTMDVIRAWGKESIKDIEIPPTKLNNPNTQHKLNFAWDVVIRSYQPNEDIIPGSDIEKYITVEPTPGTSYSLSAKPVS